MILVYATPPGQFERAADATYDLMEEAATDAARKTGARILAEGRANIAAAGFSDNWTRTLLVDVYPRKDKSLKPTVFLWHRIPYAHVFEEGANIQGRPLLFLPTKNVPQKIAGKKVTPKQFTRYFGPLKMVRRKTKVVLISTRKGPLGVKKNNVMFFGLRQVTVPRKWNLREIVDRAAAAFESLYFRSLRKD
jgi:hypothetical protein